MGSVQMTMKIFYLLLKASNSNGVSKLPNIKIVIREALIFHFDLPHKTNCERVGVNRHSRTHTLTLAGFGLVFEFMIALIQSCFSLSLF